MKFKMWGIMQKKICRQQVKSITNRKCSNMLLLLWSHFFFVNVNKYESSKKIIIKFHSFLYDENLIKYETLDRISMVPTNEGNWLKKDIIHSLLQLNYVSYFFVSHCRDTFPPFYHRHKENSFFTSNLKN